MQGFETIINSIIKLGIAMLVGFVCINGLHNERAKQRTFKSYRESDASDTHYNFAYKP